MMQARRLRFFCSAAQWLNSSRHVSTTRPALGFFTGRQDDSAQQTQSHSSMLSDMHNVKPGALGDFTTAYHKFATSLEGKMGENHCELVGGWRPLVGDPDATVHLWRYKKGYESMDKAIGLCLDDRPGQMIEWGNNWVKGITYRRDFNQDVGGWFSQIGQLYVVYHLWAYESLAHRKTVREHTWSKPGWDTNVAYTVPLIREMRSTMLQPLHYSPLK